MLSNNIVKGSIPQRILTQLIHINFTQPLAGPTDTPTRVNRLFLGSGYEVGCVEGGWQRSCWGDLTDVTHLPYLPQLLFEPDFNSTAVLVCVVP